MSTKQASDLTPGDIALAAGLAPFVPGSTGSRLTQGQGMRGLGAGLTTDTARGVGGLAGSSLAESVMRNGHMPESTEARLALLLAGGGIGAVAGHLAGKSVGTQLFHPDRSMIDKLRALIHRH